MKSCWKEKAALKYNSPIFPNNKHIRYKTNFEDVILFEFLSWVKMILKPFSLLRKKTAFDWPAWSDIVHPTLKKLDHMFTAIYSFKFGSWEDSLGERWMKNKMALSLSLIFKIRENKLRVHIVFTIVVLWI